VTVTTVQYFKPPHAVARGSTLLGRLVQQLDARVVGVRRRRAAETGRTRKKTCRRWYQGENAMVQQRNGSGEDHGPSRGVQRRPTASLLYGRNKSHMPP